MPRTIVGEAAPKETKEDPKELKFKPPATLPVEVVLPGEFYPRAKYSPKRRLEKGLLRKQKG